jgi:hypothetical protein
MAASPKEYREFAQDCLRWAAETQSERHRQILLEMAKTWMQAALEVERSLGLTDDLRCPPIDHHSSHQNEGGTIFGLARGASPAIRSAAGRVLYRGHVMRDSAETTLRAPRTEVRGF